MVLAGVLGPASAFEYERDGLIIYYFSLGYSYRLIVCFLFFVHGILLSNYAAVKKNIELLWTTEEASTFGQGSVQMDKPSTLVLTAADLKFNMWNILRNHIVRMCTNG